MFKRCLWRGSHGDIVSFLFWLRSVQHNWWQETWKKENSKINIRKPRRKTKRKCKGLERKFQDKNVQTVPLAWVTRRHCFFFILVVVCATQLMAGKTENSRINITMSKRETKTKCKGLKRKFQDNNVQTVSLAWVTRRHCFFFILVEICATQLMARKTENSRINIRKPRRKTKAKWNVWQRKFQDKNVQTVSLAWVTRRHCVSFILVEVCATKLMARHMKDRKFKNQQQKAEDEN